MKGLERRLSNLERATNAKVDDGESEIVIVLPDNHRGPEPGRYGRVLIEPTDEPTK